MFKTIVIYGLALAAMVLALRMMEYQYLIHDFTLEFYLGVVAIFFAAFGVWIGTRLIRKGDFSVNASLRTNLDNLKKLGLSPRENEVLVLIASGHSNQEIADKLFVSLNTIKTHTSSIFSKLDVKRRTQAIQKAKELQVIG